MLVLQYLFIRHYIHIDFGESHYSFIVIILIMLKLILNSAAPTVKPRALGGDLGGGGGGGVHVNPAIITDP